MRYSRIKICDIDTKNLKVMSEKERTKLFKKLKESSVEIQRKKIKDKLMIGNLKLALSTVQKFSNRRETSEDIFQVACIGLIKAIEKFDIDLGTRFSTYAIPMMMGEIKRHLRDNNPMRVSRIMRNIAYKALIEKENMTQEEKKEPTIKELARNLKIDPEKLALALESVISPISIFEPTVTVGKETLYLIDQIKDPDSDSGWINQLAMHQSVNKLNIKQKIVLSLRFFRGKTQSEIAKEMNVSQAQVSRLEKIAIKKITGLPKLHKRRRV
ncbi:MAG: sigma-70 family RNA polymerase sigma factor [Oscillospiraceae bacterium]|nr:sigma-70 family RNA polymerase sigma factor [Oscillospiraceae bacterium]